MNHAPRRPGTPARGTRPGLRGPSTLSRRVFVRWAGGMAAGVAFTPWMACRAEREAPTPAGDMPFEACSSFLTPTDTFFRQFGGRATVDDWQMPDLDAEAFQLRIAGLVETPMALTLSDLEAATDDHVTVLNTLMCILGYRGTAIWTGIPLRVLLERAGIDWSTAVRLRFFGADGFENNLRATDIAESPPELFAPLIAFRIYDEPLPAELGFPFRLMLADRYGYKNIKWLERIEVTDGDAETGQYQERGYPDAGVIEPAVVVEDSRVMQEVMAGPVQLCGTALSGAAGIESVEVALNGGDYEAVQLASPEELVRQSPELARTLQFTEPERFAWPPAGIWVAWQHGIELSPGEHTVDVRVRDRAGGMGDGTTLRLQARP